MDNLTHGQEVASGERFAFGANWARYLRTLDDRRIQDATESLARMLETQDLRGRSFLDVGSGSGLFSLAAKRLGARVTSFDYDPQSVECTKKLKSLYYPDDADWDIQAGSVLDKDYMRNLGQFDVVYSWGVLHHTGAMWDALANVDANVAPDGKLFIALYNKQQFASTYWKYVKKTYNKFPISRPLFVVAHGLYPTLPSVFLKAIQGRKYPRGMNTLHDLIDWLGGYPFEVSKPEEILEFYKARGYRLTKLKTVGGKVGCNEYVFQKQATQ